MIFRIDLKDYPDDKELENAIKMTIGLAKSKKFRESLAITNNTYKVPLSWATLLIYDCECDPDSPF